MKTSEIASFPCSVNRYKTALLFVEVIDSNPNGDPDRNGRPRVSEDGRGWISSQSVKRMVRDFVNRHHAKDLYVERGKNLQNKRSEFLTEDKSIKSGIHEDKMLNRYYDLRVFGGALPVKGKGGARIRGPVQVTNFFSEQVVSLVESTLTRSASDGEEKESGPDGANMGSRTTVAYGLYRGEVTYSPADGIRSGAQENDLQQFWDGLLNGWPENKSSARSNIRLRKAYIFESSAPADGLATSPGRCELPSQNAEKAIQGDFKNLEINTFEDFGVSLDRSKIPDRVDVYEWSDGEFRKL
jgi:CRISPR-associated protein Csd2